MGSAALAAAVPYPYKATRTSGKGQRNTLKNKPKKTETEIGSVMQIKSNVSADSTSSPAVYKTDIII